MSGEGLGLVAIPVILFPFYAIDPLVGILATAAFVWVLAGFVVRGRGLRIVALAGLVVAATTFLGFVLAVAVQRGLEHGTSLADISATVQRFSTAFSLAGSIAWILAGFLSIWIVIEIERRQHARAKLARGRGPVAPTAAPPLAPTAAPPLAPTAAPPLAPTAAPPVAPTAAPPGSAP